MDEPLEGAGRLIPRTMPDRDICPSDQSPRPDPHHVSAKMSRRSDAQESFLRARTWLVIGTIGLGILAPLAIAGGDKGGGKGGGRGGGGRGR